jgi:hypothetical protein
VETLDGVQDTGGIVHHTIRIGRNGKGLVAETLSYGISKTRTHEEYFFAGLYQEWRFIDGYLSTKFHYFT